MKIISGHATQIISETNEQQPLLSSQIRTEASGKSELCIAVLTNAVSGLKTERTAAYSALKTVLKNYQHPTLKTNIPNALQRTIRKTNQIVRDVASKTSQPTAIGVSIVIIIIVEYILHWIAVGDNKLYCLRDNELVELTHEQTAARLMRENVMDGKLSLSKIDTFPERNGLVSYLGMETIPDIDATLKPFTLKSGDKLLLCSNGLHSALNNENIAPLLVDSPQVAATQLVELASQTPNANQQEDIQAVVLAFQTPVQIANLAAYQLYRKLLIYVTDTLRILKNRIGGEYRKLLIYVTDTLRILKNRIGGEYRKLLIYVTDTLRILKNRIGGEYRKLLIYVTDTLRILKNRIGGEYRKLLIYVTDTLRILRNRIGGEYRKLLIYATDTLSILGNRIGGKIFAFQTKVQESIANHDSDMYYNLKISILGVITGMVLTSISLLLFYIFRN